MNKFDHCLFWTQKETLGIILSNLLPSAEASPCGLRQSKANCGMWCFQPDEMAVTLL